MCNKKSNLTNQINVNVIPRNKKQVLELMTQIRDSSKRMQAQNLPSCRNRSNKIGEVVSPSLSSTKVLATEDKEYGESQEIRQ
jgi:hypothetical protein